MCFCIGYNKHWLPVEFIETFKIFLLEQFYLKYVILTDFIAGNDMFKVNNINTTPKGEICSKLTMKTPE